MKNTIKIGVLALTIAISFAACKGSGSASTDSTTVKTDSTAVKTDSTVKVDTVKKDTTVKK